MLTEEQSYIENRYLISDEYYSEEGIIAVKSELIKRYKSNQNAIKTNELYNKFINWKINENEIMLYTLYAYADLNIPIEYDVIFQFDNPNNYCISNFIITQVLWEGWLPDNKIEHGHKHICVCTFNEKIPEIFNILNVQNNLLSIETKKHTDIGLCNQNNFSSIKQSIEKINKLKKIYGYKWHEYYKDNE